MRIDEEMFGMDWLKVVFVFVVSLHVVFCHVEIHNQDHLSKHAHFEGEQHNPQYDHDAFLGPKQAMEFEELSEEDAKKRLRGMIPLLDTDKDGLISPEELEAWIEKQRKVFMYDIVDEHIEKEDKDGDKMISWTEFMKERFGEWEHENFPKDEVEMIDSNPWRPALDRVEHLMVGLKFL